MKSEIVLMLVFAGIFLDMACAGTALPIAPPVGGNCSVTSKAENLFQQGRKNAAMEIARPLAMRGNADALFLLAYAMESEEPPRQSRAQAMDFYYRRAAAAGHSEAEFRRQLILLGSTDEKERNEAIKRLETAMSQGNGRAGRILGEAWLRGLCNGKPTFSTAVEWWKKSADTGDAASFLLVAGLYEGRFGFTDQTDPAAALEWYRKAAGKGLKEAFVPLGSLLLEGPQDLRNEKEGHEWLKKAMEGGEGAAWISMAEYEETVKTNPLIATEWYRRGAEAGHAECQWQMARRLAEPQFGSPARAWLIKAAEQGHPSAAGELGRLLLKDGKTTTSAAYHLLLTAAREGVAQAQYDLGMYYLNEDGMHADDVSAVAWLTEAMKSGDAEAQYQLALLHEQGRGVPINYANAGVLYTMACTKGHAAAAGRIAFMAMEGLGTKRSLAQAWAHACYAVESGDVGSKQVLTSLEGKLDAAQTAEAEKTLLALRAQKKPTQGSLATSVK